MYNRNTSGVKTSTLINFSKTAVPIKNRSADCSLIFAEQRTATPKKPTMHTVGKPLCTSVRDREARSSYHV